MTDLTNAKILVIDDDPDILVAARVVLLQRFRNVYTSSDFQSLDEVLKFQNFDLILLDMNFSMGYTSGKEGLRCLDIILARVPNQPVIVMTAYGSIKLAVEAMKHGAMDFIVKPWENEKLEATVIAAINKIRSINSARPPQDISVSLVSNSPKMKVVQDLADRVAPTDAAVLILGESGTGKEVLADYIHRSSKRSSRPFVKIDLGAFPPNLFESEMFGHKKGAFTDAREDRPGRIELAEGGTLFLDEISNLPLILQSKLLSVLQTHRFSPVGSAHSLTTDFRLICASNQDVRMLAAQGLFREDLVFRMNTVEIKLPPLRERKEDIEPLAEIFLQRYKARHGKPDLKMARQAIDFLINHAWPGNIRELEHSIERAIIMSDGNTLKRDDFDSVLKLRDETESLHHEEVERQAIMKALKKHQGNMLQAARELGFARSTLYRKVQRYGL